jgi:glycosyltransferase involved in cell wall biosynthesis
VIFLNILCISPSIPVPISGGRRHVYQVLKILSKFHTINLISAENQHLDQQTLDKFPLDFLKSMKSVQISYTSSITDKFLTIMGFYREFNRFLKKELINTISQSIAIHEPDIILIQEICMIKPTLKALDNINKLRVIKAICVAHNDDAQILKTKGESKSYFLQIIYSRAFKSANKYQSRWLSQLDGLITLTQYDYQTLSNLVTNKNLKFLLFGNGVDCEEFYLKTDKITSNSKNKILFMGDYSYSANFQSIKWFIENVLPFIPQELDLIGIPSKDGMNSLVKQNKKVIYHGLVDDVIPFINNTSVCIAPILFGSGSRLKILEYLSLEKIVVTTSIGVQGLNLIPDVHYLEANTSNEFINHLNSIAANGEKYLALGKSGRQFIINNWDWNVLVLCQLFND